MKVMNTEVVFDPKIKNTIKQRVLSLFQKGIDVDKALWNRFDLHYNYVVKHLGEYFHEDSREFRSAYSGTLYVYKLN